MSLLDAAGLTRFAFAAVVDVPLRDAGRRAAEVEALGFDRLWLPDERLTRNVYTALTLSALETRRIELGVSVTNPYTRNVAITAAAVASVDELSDGRLSLGFGAGGGLGHYGVERSRPAVAVREAVEVVRLLLDGQRVTYDGVHVRMHDAQLDFTAQRQVPIYIAARGPRLLELAGRIADGAIIGGFASDEGIAHARDLIGRGLERSKRNWSDIDLVAWLYTSVADDTETARRAVSRLVATSLVTSREILDSLGLDLPRELRDCLDASGWSVASPSIDECSRHLSDEIIDAFSVAGTPSECARKLARLAETGMRELAMVALPAPGQTADDLARRLAREVLPEVRDRIAARSTA